jgi:2'-5' RNA ligase
MRLFVSVDLDDDLADAVADVQEEFRAADGLSFTDPEQAHVTLKFLGETPENRVRSVGRELRRAVDAARVEPFTAEFGGLGVFPHLGYIRVLWLGVWEGGEELTRLHEAVERRMVELGFDEEDHEFTPHLTLARMEHADGKELVQERVESLDPDVGSMAVSEVRLTESRLTDDGPVYSTVEAVEL